MNLAVKSCHCSHADRANALPGQLLTIFKSQQPWISLELTPGVIEIQPVCRIRRTAPARKRPQGAGTANTSRRIAGSRQRPCLSGRLKYLLTKNSENFDLLRTACTRFFQRGREVKRYRSPRRSPAGESRVWPGTGKPCASGRGNAARTPQASFAGLFFCEKGLMPNLHGHF